MRPASLKTDELLFFDKHEDKIVKAILPSYQHDPEAERKKLLIEKSEIEDQKNDSIDDTPLDDDEMSSEVLLESKIEH
ncbi:MAG: hypothetical protein U5Q03_07885 [Bacteroidota bacterium]|nr:hypothetical protein [Bacteroidota bacterium]